MKRANRHYIRGCRILTVAMSVTHLLWAYGEQQMDIFAHAERTTNALWLNVVITNMSDKPFTVDKELAFGWLVGGYKDRWRNSSAINSDSVTFARLEPVQTEELRQRCLTVDPSNAVTCRVNLVVGTRVFRPSTPQWARPAEYVVKWNTWKEIQALRVMYDGRTNLGSLESYTGKSAQDLGFPDDKSRVVFVPVRKPSRMEISADAVKTPNALWLNVTITNISDRPFVVDKELSLGWDIGVFDIRGSNMFHSIIGSDSWTVLEPVEARNVRERCISVFPGQVITCQVNIADQTRFCVVTSLRPDLMKEYSTKWRNWREIECLQIGYDIGNIRHALQLGTGESIERLGFPEESSKVIKVVCRGTGPPKQTLSGSPTKGAGHQPPGSPTKGAGHQPPGSPTKGAESMDIR